MPRFAVYAADQMYGGFHGMCTRAVIDSSDREAAEDYARTESYEIMQSYSEIYEDFDERLEEIAEDNPDITEEELETIREELYNEDTDWAVWEINEEVAKDYPTHTLDTMFYENPEDFIDEYCIIE